MQMKALYQNALLALFVYLLRLLARTTFAVRRLINSGGNRLLQKLPRAKVGWCWRFDYDQLLKMIIYNLLSVVLDSYPETISIVEFVVYSRNLQWQIQSSKIRPWPNTI